MSEHSKAKKILIELIEHLPFSIFGAIVSILLIGAFIVIAKLMQAEEFLPQSFEQLFHLFHPVHVLFSAIATTAMFWKHDNRNIYKAILVGFVGSIVVCGISDIFFPYLGGLLFGMDMHMHICVLEEPQLVFPFATIGVLAGLGVGKSFENSTQYSHSVHVFISSMASLLYLLSYGIPDLVAYLGVNFTITVVAVIIPCCLSDIIFPLACTHKYCHHKPEDFKH